MNPHSKSMLNVAKLSLALVFLVVLGTRSASAQVQLGMPKYGSFGGGPFDSINFGNLNTHLAIPIFHKPGRQLPLDYDLTYDTSIWQPVNSGGTTAWYPASGWGWNGSALNIGSIISAARGYDYQYYFSCETYYFDGFGTPHVFTPGWVDPNWVPNLWGCALYDYVNLIDYPQTAVAPDGSGYTFGADLCQWVGGNCQINFDSSNLPLAVENLTAANGNGIVPQGTYPLNPAVSAGSALDRNGNEITVDSSGNYKDTLGIIAITQTGGNPNPRIYTYTDSSGHQNTIRVTFKAYTVATNFRCSGIAEFAPQQVYLVDLIILPNGRSYQFNYETTAGMTGDVTGRLASITLPTGGTITYTYTGGSNGITCADGTAAGLTRQTPDGTWTYTRTPGSGTASTTTLTDPSSSSNQTVIQFQNPTGLGLSYETQRQLYQGSSSPSRSPSGQLRRSLAPCSRSTSIRTTAPTECRPRPTITTGAQGPLGHCSRRPCTATRPI